MAPPVDTSLGVLVLAPGVGDVVGTDQVVVEGVLNEPAEVTVAGVAAVVGDDLTFRATVPGLTEGRNDLRVVAVGPDGERATVTIAVVLDTVAPAAPVVTSVRRLDVNLVEVAGTTEPGATIGVVNTTLGTDFREVLAADDAGAFDAALLAATGHVLSITVRDAGGHFVVGNDGDRPPTP